MLQFIEGLAGAILVLLVFADAVMTTLTVSTAAGPLTSLLLPLLWRGMLRVHRHESSSPVLAMGGAALLLITVATWIVGLWGGWWLIFLGADTIEAAGSGRPAGGWDVGYFSGITLVTLGTGDYVAGSTAWRLVSAVASFSGLFLVTLAITYLISVVSAVVARRSLAIHIRGLGGSAEEMVTRAWTGQRFSGMFEQQLIALTPVVATAAEQHLAYPVLHYFHSTERDLSAPLALASLNDALLLAGQMTATEARPDRTTVSALTFALERYLDAATEVAWVPEVASPEPPSIEDLRQHGIPLLDGEERAEALDEAEPRRTRLHQLVVSDGWTWTRSASG